MFARGAGPQGKGVHRRGLKVQKHTAAVLFGATELRYRFRPRIHSGIGVPCLRETWRMKIG